MNSLKRIPFIALAYSAFFTKSWNYDNAYERKKHKRELKQQYRLSLQPNFLIP